MDDALVPLRLDHAYLRGNALSPYWSLAPQLIQQHTDSSCSLDPARDLALILDVYKKDYEPLWVPLERLTVAMATRGKRTGEARGYAVIRKTQS